MAFTYTWCLIFKGTDSLIANFEDRLSVCTLASQKFDMERFKLRKLNKVEVTEDI
jgi:hypothetical protein